MAADGQVLIETKIDSSGMDAGAKEIVAAMKELTSTMKGFAESFNASFEKVGAPASKAKKNVDEVADSMANAKDEAKDLQAAMDNITVEHFDASFPDEELESFNSQIDESASKMQGLEAATKETGEAINSAYNQQNILDWIDGFENSTNQVNEFKGEISSLTKQLEDMENKGLYFGDEEFDNAYLKLEKVKQALKDYKKELVSPTPDALKVDTSTLEGQIQKLSETLYRLREQGQSFGNEEYDKTAQSLKRAQDALANYKKELLMSDEQKQQAAKMREIGESARVSSPYIVMMAEELDRLKKRQLELQAAGIGIGFEEYDANAKKISELSAKLKGYTSTTKKASKETTKLKDSLKKTDKAAVPLTKSVLKLGNMFKLMLLRMAMRSVINGAKEGFENLAQYSEDTNVAISSLMSAMTQLKNAFATAFTPVLETVAPILTQFIGLLAEAVTWVAQLLAALTGSDTFIKAIKVQEDYAASLDDTTKSTEEAAEETEKALAPFDDLVQMQKTKTDTSSSSSDTSVNDMFTTEEVTNEVKAQAEAIKDLFESLFEPLKNAWDEHGQTVIDSVKNAFESLKELASAVGDSFLKAWNDMGYGERITGNLLQAFANLADTVAILADRFREAWEAGGLGDSIMQHLLEIVEIFSEKILRASEIIKEWVATLDFTPILTAFDGLLAAAIPLVDTVGDALLWLLEYVLLPLASWTIEDAIPAFFDLLAAALKVINEVLIALQPLWQWFWDTVLQPIASFVGDAFISFLNLLTDGLTAFSQWCSENQGVIQNAVIIIASFFAAWAVVTLVAGISSVVGALVTFVSGIAGAVAAAGGLGAAIAALVTPFGLAVVAVGAVIAAITLLAYNWDSLSGTVGNAIANIMGTVSSFGTNVASVFGIIGSNITSAWDSVRQNTSSAISEMWSSISNGLANIAQSVAQYFSSIIMAFLEGWNSCQDNTSRFMAGIRSAIDEALSGLPSLFQSVFGSLANIVAAPFEAISKIVEGFFNSIIEMIEKIKEAISNLSSTASGISSSGSSGGSFSSSSGSSARSATASISSYAATTSAYDSLSYNVPQLATGTVVPPNAGKFLAMLGDNNRDYEVVSPVETMKQAFKDVITELGGLNNGGQTVEAIMTVDGTKFGKLVAKFGNAENQRVGVTMVTEG